HILAVVIANIQINISAFCVVSDKAINRQGHNEIQETYPVLLYVYLSALGLQFFLVQNCNLLLPILTDNQNTGLNLPKTFLLNVDYRIWCKCFSKANYTFLLRL